MHQISTLEDLAEEEQFILVDNCAIHSRIFWKDGNDFARILYCDNPEKVIDDFREIYAFLDTPNVFTVLGVIREFTGYIERFNNFLEFQHNILPINKRTKNFQEIIRILKKAREKLREKELSIRYHKKDERYKLISNCFYDISRKLGIVDRKSTDVDLLTYAVYLSTTYEDLRPSIITNDYDIVRRLLLFKDMENQHNIKLTQDIKIYSNYEWWDKSQNNLNSLKINLIYHTDAEDDEKFAFETHLALRKITHKRVKKVHDGITEAPLISA